MKGEADPEGHIINKERIRGIYKRLKATVNSAGVYHKVMAIKEDGRESAHFCRKHYGIKHTQNADNL